MVDQARVNVHETMGRKNNCKLNFFSMYLVRNNNEIPFYFKNREKYQTKALTNPTDTSLSFIACMLL